MNFVLFENKDGKESFVFENDLKNLPIDTIAFTYYQQDSLDENGLVIFHEYRIGIPIKFVTSDMYVEVEYSALDTQRDDIYCLYIHDEKKLSKPIKRIVKPINKNTTLVNNFSELEEVFASITKKTNKKKTKIGNFL